MNLLPLLACAVIAVVLGILWYGPIFGRPWRKEMGVTDADVAEARKDPNMQKQMLKSALLAAVGALVTALVLSRMIALLKASGSVALGVHIAFWSWLGFAVPVLLGAVLWESKTWKWWLITIGYYLVSWILMGIVLTLWG